jgi:hypothetical protein
MPNLTNWFRWGDRKWHLLSENPSFIESICGKAPSRSELIELTTSETVPEDEHGVCMSCWRWREKKARQEEAYQRSEGA